MEYPYRRRNSDLYHWGFKKDHKYVAKVKVTPRRWRYFYDKDEYEAYLKAKQKTDALRTRLDSKNDVKKISVPTPSVVKVEPDKKTDVKSLFDNASEWIKKATKFVSDKLENLNTSVIEPKVSKGKEFIDDAGDFLSAVVDAVVDEGEKIIKKTKTEDTKKTDDAQKTEDINYWDEAYKVTMFPLDYNTTISLYEINLIDDIVATAEQEGRKPTLDAVAATLMAYRASENASNGITQSPTEIMDDVERQLGPIYRYYREKGVTFS